jgi:integrase
LLALARYGGVRCPSEPLGLEWSDVNWERKRFRVVAPKTKHESGGERWVPLFPDLAEILERVYFALQERGSAAPSGPVITRWRDSALNLRTGLYRILRRAGVKPWPRLLQNLRASRDTELAGKFPMHVAAEWLGHSPKTALAHYLRTTEADFAAATDPAAVERPPADPTGRASPNSARPDTPTAGRGNRDGVMGRELAPQLVSS